MKNRGYFIFFSLIFLFNNSYSMSTNINECLDSAAVLKENMDYSGAIEVLENCLSIDSSVYFETYLGKLYYLRGDLIKAYKTLKKIKEKDWEVFLYLGLIFESLNNKKLAIKNYLNSINLRKNTIALYRIAKIYYKDEKYHYAIKFFSEVLKLDPSIRLANHYLADCLYKINDYKNAYTYYQKSFLFYPKNQEAKRQIEKIKKSFGEKLFIELDKVLEKKRYILKLPFFIKKRNIPVIKVGIAKDLEKFSFRCGNDFLISDGKKEYKAEKDKIYTVSLKDNNIFLVDYENNTIYEKFRIPIFISTNNYPFYIFDIMYGKGHYWQKKIDRIYRGNLEVRVLDDKLVLINILSIEEYLYGVLPAEIPATSPLEALKAQAVAARTIAIKNLSRHKEEGFDVCADIHCQVYQGMSVETSLTNTAVDSTFGEILVSDGKPINAFYHANCGGCLRSDAFGKEKYLKNKFDTIDESPKKLSPYYEDRWFIEKPDTFCYKENSSFRWQRVYDSTDFYFVFGYDLKDLKAILPTKKGECFHYKEVKIITTNKNLHLSGELKIRDYFDKLRSSAFKASIHFSTKGEPTMLFLWGAGFGHGSGLCQEGAIGMALDNYSYRKILKHYYQNCNIEKYY